ncbi:MAG: PD-(D/E)XK nuclease domain-containing protein, partial [Methyloprofundus sp.]|nr:PD-(D/E)XK nuclease domain-containing protein [Methyloprofundus sp.]
LEDISLNPDYASLCGYTEKEIKQVFTGYAEATDFELLREWYNGYNFLGEKVYNPFDVLLYFKNKEFKNYWFETGSPAFLLKLIRERQYNLPDMEKIMLLEADLGSFDVNDITLETVLFQTGYLTIERVEAFDGDKVFYLTYPNREVKTSLNQYLLRDLTQSTPSEITRNRVAVYKALQQADFDALQRAFSAIFAAIPHDWYRKNNIAHYEGYYASIVYSCFCAMGFTVIAEDTTNHGRIDLTLIQKNKIFIIEFKVIGSADQQGAALAQIKAKNYQQKYQAMNKEIYLVGMEFDGVERNLVDVSWEQC